MAIYIDRAEAGDLESLSAAVISYVVRQHNIQIPRFQDLKNAYLARNGRKAEADDDVSIVVDYPRYIVETLKGYYLGDPVKYTVDDDEDKLTRGQRVWIDTEGTVRKAEKMLTPDDDISPVLDAYRHQTISDVDSSIGKDLGIYGEAYELIYANEDSQPMSCVCDPIVSFMVRDNSVDHKKLFFVRFDKRKHVSGVDYYVAYVYTDKTESLYATSNLERWDFAKIDQNPHYFGEVPAVEYSNNDDRLGDFETQLSLIDAYNFLMSDRCTDKARFVKSVLALYGADLTEEMVKGLKEHGILAGLPIDSKLEYIQKLMNESDNHVLANDLVREIHKQSMTVDMTDEAFSGNTSGVSLKLKLLTMSMLVKNKIRSFEKGLKKRFEIYDHYLMIQGTMGYVDKDQITPIFTLSLPIDEQGIVSIVKQLDGIVDTETLLSLLWFVKDPAATLAKVKAEKRENQRAYLDTFGITAKKTENIGGDEEDEENGTNSGENSE